MLQNVIKDAIFTRCNYVIVYLLRNHKKQYTSNMYSTVLTSPACLALSQLVSDLNNISPASWSVRTGRQVSVPNTNLIMSEWCVNRKGKKGDRRGLKNDRKGKLGMKRQEKEKERCTTLRTVYNLNLLLPL